MQETFLVGGVSLATHQPTNLTFAQLDSWIIWQFPRRCEDWLCGAVHPPIAEHGWYPAAIYPQDAGVQVHAHAPERFPTPEAAARWLELAEGTGSER